MIDLGLFTQLFGECLLVAAVGMGARLAIFAMVEHSSQSVSTEINPELPPAEIAYLLREGDMGHTMVVMAVDLIQRAVKESTNVQLHPYEQQVWSNVQDFAKNMAKEKVNTLIPVDDIKNPIQWAVRFRALKTFFAQTLRAVVSEVVKDPRNIKRYFSITGIARLALQLYTSSSKQGVEASLHQELSDAGLLVSEPRRQAGAMGMVVLMLAAIGVVSVMCVNLTAANLLPFAAAAALNAVVVRGILAIPGFIPSYDEFDKLAQELKRGGLRLAIVRHLLRMSKGIIAIASLVALVFLLVIELTITLFLHGIIWSQAILVILGFSVVALFVLQLVLDARDLLLKDLPTAKARNILRRIKSRLAAQSPLSTFSNTLTSPDYDPTLSEIVALYGIETLWLLS